VTPPPVTPPPVTPPPAPAITDAHVADRKAIYHGKADALVTAGKLSPGAANIFKNSVDNNLVRDILASDSGAERISALVDGFLKALAENVPPPATKPKASILPDPQSQKAFNPVADALEARFGNGKS